MTPEELLKPRYEVIADYPGSLFTVGEIVFAYKETAKTAFDKYPTIFRPLAWWEHRKPEEMPEYVKYAENGMVAKVDHFDLETTSAWFMHLIGGIHPYCPGGSALENTHWLPATETEYQEYLKSKV